MTAYHRPATLEEALRIRSAEDVVVLAGGTDVFPAKANRAGWGERTHKPVLDISALPGLNRIEEREDHWRIGCLVTWTAIAEANLPPLFDGLRHAARHIGGRQVQNRGTLAGNLVTASPAGDGIPNLMALDAQIEMTSSRGVRTLPIAEFQTGYRATACAADELVTAILVPKLDGGQGAFQKLGARTYLVISIAMVASVVALDTTGRIARTRLAIGACSAVAARLPGLERDLTGVTPAEAAQIVSAAHLARLNPIDDVRASASYRRAAALTLLRDLVTGFAENRRAA